MADNFIYKDMSLQAVKLLAEKCKRNNVKFETEAHTNHRYDIVIYTSKKKWKDLR
jgi:hypothetical protein